MKKYQFVINQVSIIIVLGIFGFLMALAIVGGRSLRCGTVKYRELELPDSSVQNAVRWLHQSRKGLLEDSLRNIKTINDSTKTARKAIKDALAANWQELADLEKGRSDSGYYFKKYIAIDHRKLARLIKDSAWDKHDTLRLPFAFTDSILFEPFKDSLVIVHSRPGKLMSVFDKNPFAAFWIILSTAQMSMWFVITGLIVAVFFWLKKKLANSAAAGIVTGLNWGLSSILPLLFLGVFTFLFYFFMIDDFVIKDHYLLQNFNAKMKIYAPVGYVAAIACFGMFLLSSMALDELNSNAQLKGWSIQTNTALKENYDALKKGFDASFLATALILTVFVLWSGVLFKAVNDTNVMKLYSGYAGHDLLSYDYIYLLGAFHTVILLLFYIPVKIKFNSMKITEEDKSSSANDGKAVLKSLYESITDLLITASPLLAGLLQKLLGNVFS